MPVVFVTRDPKVLEDRAMPVFTSHLVLAVVDNLSVPGTKYRVNRSDVSIRVHDKGPFDTTTHSVEIVILAGMHPERKENCKEREQKIREALERCFRTLPGPTMNFFVWVTLVDGAFGQGYVRYDERISLT